MLQSAPQIFIPLIILCYLATLCGTPEQPRTIPDHYIPLCTPEPIPAATCPATHLAT